MLKEAHGFEPKPPTYRLWEKVIWNKTVMMTMANILHVVICRTYYSMFYGIFQNIDICGLYAILKEKERWKIYAWGFMYTKEF